MIVLICARKLNVSRSETRNVPIHNSQFRKEFAVLIGSPSLVRSLKVTADTSHALVFPADPV